MVGQGVPAEARGQGCEVDAVKVDVKPLADRLSRREFPLFGVDQFSPLATTRIPFAVGHSLGAATGALNCAERFCNC